MTSNPVQDLIDQLKLMRVELGEVKARQLTDHDLEYLHATLKLTDSRLQSVANAAEAGGREGAEKLFYSFERLHSKIDSRVGDATYSLSEARREASSSILSRRHNVRLFMAFSALTGLATGALLTLIVFDHYLERDFKDSIQFMGWDWSCTKRDGFISDQDNGKFCAFEISE